MALKAKTTAPLYYTVGQAAQLLGENTSTLKYWEKEFSQYIKPRFSSKGTRYYSQTDIKNFRAIIRLRESGYTLEGIRIKLSTHHSPLEQKEAILMSLESCLKKLKSIERQIRPQQE